ncbi:MAG: hypothetical protein WCL00_02800 [Bacteroidota bacterium]
METTEKRINNRSNCYSPRRWVGWVILGIVGITVFAFLFGAVIMYLWNWLMPVIFHLGAITYWQAVGIAVLARMLFGSFHHGGQGGKRGHGGWGHGRWGHHGNQCGHSNADRWNYYEQYWNEEGEKAFNDYVSRKNESQVK